MTNINLSGLLDDTSESWRGVKATNGWPVSISDSGGDHETISDGQEQRDQDPSTEDDFADDELNISEQLGSRVNRRSFLITYAKADMFKFPTRGAFADAVVTALSETGQESPVQWACALESHKDDTPHYHLAVKFATERKWLSAKQYLHRNHDIVVNFAAKAKMYIAAYKYVTKCDEQVLLSHDHPSLDAIRSPRTKKCVNASSEAAGKRRSSAGAAGGAAQGKKPRPTRLTNADVSEFIFAKDIRTSTELEASAMKRFDDGEKVTRITRVTHIHKITMGKLFDN